MSRKRAGSNSDVGSLSEGRRPTDEDDVSNTRHKKPNLHGTARAIRACTICRRQKTRCFPCPGKLACLRCTTLGLDCSLEEMQGPDSDQPDAPVHKLPTDTRLDRLEAGVNEILSLLRENRIGRGSDIRSHSREPLSGKRRIPRRVGPAAADEDSTDLSVVQSPALLSTADTIVGIGVEGEGSATSFGTPSTTFTISPFNIYGTLCSADNHPDPVTRLYNPQMVIHDQDIISLGLLSMDEALELFEYFCDNFNRWVSFPDNVTRTSLLDKVRQRCSLLLSVCCCVALLYYKQRSRFEPRYQLLLRKMYAELTQSLTVVPQTIEFMQALALISIYASSLSQGDMIFDGWFYSSIALEHFVTKDVLGLVMSFDGVGPVTEFEEITCYRVWNHLCLSHLVCCVMSGRMCILDEIRLDLCRRTLDLSSATNFDGRMVAEISLQLIVYNAKETLQRSLRSMREEFQQWLDEWGYLFDQPAIQFVESGYHYGYFMILFQFAYYEASNEPQDFGPSFLTSNLTTSTSPAPVEHILKNTKTKYLVEMLQHLEKVVDALLNVENPLYFSALSDQVFFCASFSGVMMASILRVMETSKRLDSVGLTYIQQQLSNLKIMAKQFQTSSVSSSDLLFRYSNALSQNILTVETQIFSKKNGG